jgi:energy-coupling factor transport system ATP-binding protein
MISLENICFSYPTSTRPVFCDLTLKIERGSWVLITGPDCSGKTTLCKLVKGLLRPTSGSVAFDDSRGQDSVGYLGGDPYDSLVGITVAEDVIFGLENLSLTQQEMAGRFEEALRWTGLSGMEGRLIHTLSGGEQQKLALAGALSGGSSVLVIDEALNMLDKATLKTARDLLQSLREERALTIIEAGSAIFFQPPVDRIIFLSDGKIASDSGVDAFAASELGSRWIRLTGGLEALLPTIVGLPGGSRFLNEMGKRRWNIKT